MTNKPIYIKIYDKLKSAIKGGTYPPGSFLPTEQELETLYQVSRTTIRKAVKLLSDEGILSVRQARWSWTSALLRIITRSLL